MIESEPPFSNVEHIGSAAIHGALTKGDIDLYVEVPEDIHSKSVPSVVRFMGSTPRVGDAIPTLRRLGAGR